MVLVVELVLGPGPAGQPEQGQGQRERQRREVEAGGQAAEEGRGRRVFLGLAPQLGQAAAAVQVVDAPAPGLAAPAERARAAGPAGRRPGQHLLEAVARRDGRPRRLEGAAPDGGRARAERRGTAAHLELRAEERRRELGGQLGREEQRGGRRLDRPEAPAAEARAAASIEAQRGRWVRMEWLMG